MNKIFIAFVAISFLALNADAKKIKFDYSVVNVPEEDLIVLISRNVHRERDAIFIGKRVDSITDFIGSD